MHDEDNGFKGLPATDFTRGLFFQQAPQTPVVSTDSPAAELPATSQTTTSTGGTNQE